MYGEIYFHEYCINNSDTPARVSIRKYNYTGSAIYVDAGPVPFVKAILNNEEDKIGGIYPTSCTVQLIGDEDFGMDDIFTASDADFQIVHLIDNKIDWIGFMSPENFEEEDTQGNRYLNITGFDGLTKLKDLPFVDSNGQNYGVADGIFSRDFLFVIKECLLKTGLTLDFKTLTDRKPLLVNTQEYVIDALGFNDGTFAFGPTMPASEYAVGNYISYYQLDDGDRTIYTAKILSVAPNGTGVRLTLSNPFFVAQDTFIVAQFFDAALSTVEGNPLQITKHDLRTWLSTDPEISDFERNKNLPYYSYKDIAMSSWDVFENLAVQWDLKVTQANGMWVLESLDKERIAEQYYKYESLGDFIERDSIADSIVIPCEDLLKFKIDGNVRYIDKTLKKVSVNYNYRYRVEGDPLVNLIYNGDFSFPYIPSPPSVYTPQGWTRDVLGSPIDLRITNFEVTGQPFSRAIEITTPDEFNSKNRLRPITINMVKSDELFLEWYQRINEIFDNVPSNSYNTVICELKTPTGDVYYLVNSGDQENWNDPYYMSPNPMGRWIKMDHDRNVFHFNSNYSPSHIPGTLSEWGKVKVRCEAIPESGILTVNFVGSARLLFKTSNASKDKNKIAWSYVVDWEEYYRSGEINYIQDNINRVENVTFYKGQWNPYVQIADVMITRVSSSQQGKGRVYRYEQRGEYFDSIENINVYTGDEKNVDHISQMTVNDVVTDKWMTTDNSLDIGPLGMMLAKSIMRRYYSPNKCIDGGFGIPDMQLNASLILEDDEGVIYDIRQGEVSSKDNLFNGTVQQIGLDHLPFGGQDMGANSLTGGSGGGSSGVSGASQSWVSAQNYINAANATLQKTLERGSESNMIMTVRGVRHGELLSVPTVPPLMEDRLFGEKYLRWDSGYLIINDDKAKVGDSDKWEGETYNDKIGQGLKPSDSPTFNQVNLTTVSVGGDTGLTITRNVKLEDDTVEIWTFKSGVLVSVESV